MSVDESRSGQSPIVKCVEVKNQIGQRIRKKRRVSSDEIASDQSNEVKKRRRNALRPGRKHYCMKE